MTQVKRLKRQHLGIEFAEPSDLPIGSQGEVITADTLKPYLDQIAQKATPAQIATAVNALETKILGGAGLDADTLAELNSKVVALQNLTDADKTGILNLLALKVNTTDIMPVINAKADEESVVSRLATKADESSVASRLATKATETSVTERLATKADESSVATRLAEKADETSVASRLAEKASIEQLLIVENLASNAVTQEILELGLTQKITAAQAETIAQSITTALENKIMGGVGTDADTMAELKALLDNLQSLSEADVNGVMQLVSEKIAKSDIYHSVVYPRGVDSSAPGATLASYLNENNLSADKVISVGLLNLLIKDLMAGIGQTAAAQSQALATFNNTLNEKLTKEEFAQLFQLLAQELSYQFTNGTSINAQVTTQKKIAFDNDIAIKKLVVGDMQIDSLAGVSFNESGYPVNTNELTSSQIGTDLPDEGGDGFLHFVVVDAEEGFVRRVKPMQLMNLLAFNVNSPVKQMFTDRDLIISELTARVQALEDLFETQPA